MAHREREARCGRSKRAAVFLLPLCAFAWVAVSGCGGKSISVEAAAAGSISSEPPTGSTVAVAASGGAPESGAAGGASSGIAGTSPAFGGASLAAGGGSSGIAGSASSAAGGAVTGAGGGPAVLCASFTTQAGLAPTKGGACVSTDQQSCYKACGPMSIGFKLESCVDGLYVEGSCEFPPDADYSCYKIPLAIDPSCPATPPQASAPCDVAACVLCNAQGVYLDSTGIEKFGYCVCPAPGASGISKWSCTPANTWPCPGNQGC